MYFIYIFANGAIVDMGGTAQELAKRDVIVVLL